MPIFTVLWALGAVLVDVAFARIAFGTLVPGIRETFALPLWLVGVVSSANVVGYLAATPFAAPLMRRYGARQTAAAAHVVAAVGAVLVGLSPSAALLIAARVITGLGGAVGLVAALRIALDAVVPARRALVSTLVWGGVGVGAIAGAFAQPALLAPNAWRDAAFVWAGLTLLIALASPVDRPRVTTTVRGAGSRGVGLVLAAYFAFGFAFLSFTTFLSLAGVGSPASRWLSIGMAAVLGAMLTLLVRRAELGFALALGVAALGAFATARGLGFGTVLVGLGLAGSPGLATAVVRERADASRVDHAIAASIFAVGAGQFVGPLVVGGLAEHFGLAIVPAVVAAVYAAGVVLLGFDARPRL